MKLQHPVARNLVSANPLGQPSFCQAGYSHDLLAATHEFDYFLCFHFASLEPYTHQVKHSIPTKG